MEIQKGKCSCCNTYTKIITSNNPLVKGSLCESCISKIINKHNLEHFGFFVRTYNLPANIELYLSILKKDPENALTKYVETLYSTEELSYSDQTTDKWKEIEKEWNKVKTHKQLLNKISQFKNDFIERSSEKWGNEYSFEELITLETLFNNIVKTLAMTNPTQIDTVKKYCKMSLLVDHLISGGETKTISEATQALTKLSDLAQIQELSETASDGTIKTVADLYKYMENNGFKFNYYDNVDRDIVDKTLHDIQGSIRNEIVNAVGLEVTFQDIKNRYLKGEYEMKENEAINEVKLDDIVAALDNDQEFTEVDEAIAAEDVIFEDDE